MSADDYILVESLMGHIYLTRKNKDPELMSSDRRRVTDDEILGMFETLLRRICEQKNDNTLIVYNDGKEIFRAILKEENNESEN